MTILFFYAILLFKQIICDFEFFDNITFNDISFKHMFIEEKYAILYFPSEFLYIFFYEKSYNICRNETFPSKIDISANKEDKSINFYFDNNKNYTFKNDDQNFTFNILNVSKIGDNLSINISMKNLSDELILNLTEIEKPKTNESKCICNQTNKDFIIYFHNITDAIGVQLLRGEKFFVKYYIFSYILIIFGYFLLLYGAYHFSIGIIFHVTLFLFFYVNDILEISLSPKINNLIYLYLFLCLIVGISMGIFLNTDKKNNKKYLLLKIFHGCSLGFSFYKLLIIYYIFWWSSAGFDENNSIFFAFSIIFIFLGVLLNIFNPFKQYIFLPASSITGSYYFVKGIKYIIGGYYSENMAIRHKINFNYDYVNKNADKKLEIILTYLFLTIILIIFSIFYQINHIKQKQEEMPIEIINPENYEISRISDLSRTSNSIRPEEEKELINTSNQNKTAVEDDDDINDQED